MASPVSLVSLGPPVSRDSLETPVFLVYLASLVSLVFLALREPLAPRVGPTSRCPLLVRAQGTSQLPRRSKC